MRPLRVQADPADVLFRYFEQVMPPILALPVEFGTQVPSDWVWSESVPFVGVFDDSGPSRWPIATLHRVRITAWADDRPSSRFVASRCLAVLLAHRIPGVGRINDPTTIIEARDPNNSGFMSSATVQVLARTQQLTEGGTP